MSKKNKLNLGDKIMRADKDDLFISSLHILAWFIIWLFLSAPFLAMSWWALQGFLLSLPEPGLWAEFERMVGVTW
jgi:hypothetical protein